MRRPLNTGCSLSYASVVKGFFWAQRFSHQGLAGMTSLGGVDYSPRMTGNKEGPRPGRINLHLPTIEQLSGISRQIASSEQASGYHRE